MKTHTSVRIQCRSHADAKELALRLQADGYAAARRRKAVVARTETHEEADRLAHKLQVGPRSDPWGVPEQGEALTLSLQVDVGRPIGRASEPSRPNPYAGWA